MAANDLSRRETFLSALKNPQQEYVQVLVDYASLTPGEANFLRQYWFNPDWAEARSNCWWPEHQPIEPVIRYGMIKAIELAMRDPDTGRERTLPIHSYWVCCSSQFEVTVACSQHQVTRINLTPRVPAGLPENLTTKSPLWVIKRGNPGEEIEQELDGVLIVRLKDRP